MSSEKRVENALAPQGDGNGRIHLWLKRKNLAFVEDALVPQGDGNLRGSPPGGQRVCSCPTFFPLRGTNIDWKKPPRISAIALIN